MHGPIPKERLKQIFTSLMDSRETERMIMALDPRQFPAHEPVQTAIVSLQDAVAMFQAVRYALVEAEAHLSFYGKDAESNPTPAAAFYAQYYMDDAYLRLPRSADLVANTLVSYLEIESREVEQARNVPGGLSQALAHYLSRHLQQSSIARACQRLYDSDDWRFVVTHRDAWLRGQCIRLHGSGIAHSRQIGWDIVEENNLDRAAKEFGSLMVNPIVRRSQLEYGLPALFARAKGGYNAMVTLFHTVYEELARSAKAAQ